MGKYLTGLHKHNGWATHVHTAKEGSTARQDQLDESLLSDVLLELSLPPSVRPSVRPRMRQKVASRV